MNLSYWYKERRFERSLCYKRLWKSKITSYHSFYSRQWYISSIFESRCSKSTRLGVVFGVVFKKIFQAMSEEISKFSKIPFILHLISPMIRNEDSPDGCYDNELSFCRTTVVHGPWSPNQESFDNLSNLMEYNVLNNAKIVRDEISQGANFQKIRTGSTTGSTSHRKFLQSYKIA